MKIRGGDCLFIPEVHKMIDFSFVTADQVYPSDILVNEILILNYQNTTVRRTSEA